MANNTTMSARGGGAELRSVLGLISLQSIVTIALVLYALLCFRSMRSHSSKHPERSFCDRAYQRVFCSLSFGSIAGGLAALALCAARFYQFNRLVRLAFLSVRAIHCGFVLSLFALGVTRFCVLRRELPTAPQARKNLYL